MVQVGGHAQLTRCFSAVAELLVNLHCVSEKNVTLFKFCDNLVVRHPMLPIFSHKRTAAHAAGHLPRRRHAPTGQTMQSSGAAVGLQAVDTLLHGAWCRRRLYRQLDYRSGVYILWPLSGLSQWSAVLCIWRRIVCRKSRCQFLQGTVRTYKIEMFCAVCVCLVQIPWAMFLPRIGKIGWRLTKLWHV